MNFLPLVCIAALLVAAPVYAETVPLAQRVAVVLANSPVGSRFGVLVVDANDREVVAINPDQRFIPASNTKLFTTAAAYVLMDGMEGPDRAPASAFTTPGSSPSTPMRLGTLMISFRLS